MPRVALSTGEIEGVTLDGDILRFMNIPYAAPPVADLRFAPPAPHEPWDGVWDGTRPGPTPPQAESWSPLHQLAAEPGHIPGSDYLNLNIWTPGLDGARPVGVYIHGGGFREGNGALRMYDGAKFARDGIVLVTINYRVGPEGFLFIEGGHANVGFDDQIAALTWIQRNIASFGGDPDRVTIFGQSAGGASVAQLMAMPDARGLFHAAINHSGPTGLASSQQDAARFSAALAEAVNVSPDLAGFRSVPPADLVRAVDRISGDISKVTDGRALPHIGPVQDPDRVPWHRTGDIADSIANPVPLLGGFTAEEMLLFTWANTAPVSEEEARSLLAATASDVDALIAACRAVHPAIGPSELVRKSREAQLFILPVLRMLNAAKASGAPVWGYEFGWRSNAFEGRPGAYHVLDIPFVFDNLETTHALQMTGPEPPQDVADRMHGEWVEFIRQGCLTRPQFDGVDSMRWFDMVDRPARSNTTEIVARAAGVIA